ncbi:Crp/Fnr family transcriptional regulator [Actinokineospora sp. HUAS TT18]|uniref:Crp/Fnr family transcriptional regulator n=1 Tax=Actinokineospora sp. HUAS TT18 TaxID=3447451 RepID=UPI003F526BE1
MTGPWPPGSLLGRLPARARDGLLELGTGVRFPSGRTILRQNEDGATAYLLVQGCVKVIANDSDRESLLAIRVGGDLVGEMAVLSGRPRSATVVTCAPTAARAIPADRLRAFLAATPDAAIELAAMLSDRFRWSNERRLASAALDPRGRVSRVLLSLAETYGHTRSDGTHLGAPLTQADIASLAGIRLPTAEKVLRGFADAGLVGLGYRDIRVLDHEALRAIAQN